ncbi:MAG: hypothetical protein WCI73_05895 [Phycisphaerae bacterium]
MSAIVQANAMTILNLLSDYVKTHRPGAPLLVATGMTGPTGLAQTAKNMVAFELIESFQKANQARLDKGGEGSGPMLPPSPFFTYEPTANGKYVVARASYYDTAARMIQLIA